MVHVLVTGAAGYIGFATALALRNRGHTVYGLVRKQDDSKRLAAHEIIPVVGDITDAKSLEVLDKVGVVIDNVMNFTDNSPLESNRQLLQAVRAASVRAMQRGGACKRYIYTSGILVYGDYPGVLVDESFPLKSKVPRVQFEQDVFKFNGGEVETAVVRPGWVYGGGTGRYTKYWFMGNANGEIEVAGRPDKQWGWVHIADLAEAYALVTEAASGLVAGEAFDVNDDTRINFQELRVLLARANGVKGPMVPRPAPADPFSQSTEIIAQTAGQKIRRRLGWVPRMGVLQDNVEVWLNAMKACGAFDK